MNALSGTPFRGLNVLNQWDDVLNGFLSPVKRDLVKDSTIVPVMDIIETAESYIVKTDLPGVKKEYLKVQVKDKLLTVEAELASGISDNENDVVIKQERMSGKYARSLRLGNAVNDIDISADYADGVLTITLPKSVQAETREIDISVH